MFLTGYPEEGRVSEEQSYLLIKSEVVQDRLSHRHYWLYDGDCGLVVWDRTADHVDISREAITA
jgi:hypothetical protein